MNRRKPHGPRLYSSATFRVVVALFYGASLILGLVPGLAYLEQVSWGLAVCTGIAVVALTSQCNVWALFTLGFIQPLFVVVRAAIEVPYVLQLGLSLWPPLRVGLACAAGGLVVSLVTSGPRAGDFSFSAWRTWMLPSWKVLGTAERVESTIKTLLAVAGLVLGILKLL